MSAIVGALRAVLSLDSAAFSRGVKDAQQAMKGLRLSMKSVGAGMQVAGAAMTAASTGIALAIKGQLDAADQMGEAAQKLGVPVEALSRLQHAAEMSGVTFDQLGTGLRKLSQGMADAAAGNKQAAALFDGLGVSVTNADGSLRQTEAVLQDVSEVISKMPDGAAKTALAMDIFGKSGADLVPLLNQGKSAIQALADEATAMGIVISTDTANAAGNFNDNLDRIRKTVGGLVLQLAAALAPALESISGHVADAAKWFQSLTPETQAFAAKLAVIGLAAGPVVLGLGFVVSSLGAVATALKAVALLALANPLVLVGVAAAAAAAAIYYYWGDIKTFFVDLWDGIKTTAQETWDGITRVAQVAVTGVTMAWTGIKQYFVTVMGNITAAFVEGWEMIKAEVSTWPARFIEYGGQIVEGLRQGIIAKWDEMMASLRGKWQELKDGFADALGIRSPSRVFRGYGQNISEGLALGIADQQPMVDGAMDGVAASLDGKGMSLADRLADFKSAAQNAFTGFVTGAQTARQALSQLAASIAQTLATKAFNSIWSGLFGGGGFKLFADGGVFNAGRMQAFAKGGVVAGATAFAMQGGMGVMGEAGPEAIMPLSRGADGKLGVRAATAGPAQAFQVTVTMDASTGALGAFVTDQAGRVVAQAAPLIAGAAVQATIERNREDRIF